jgi:hypothetical protein
MPVLRRGRGHTLGDQASAHSGFGADWSYGTISIRAIRPKGAFDIPKPSHATRRKTHFSPLLRLH